MHHALRYWQRLQLPEIEREFARTVVDLGVAIVLDDIDLDDSPPGVCMRSHDLHGPLPAITFENSGNTFVDKERLRTESCKLVAMVRLRDQITRWVSSGKFLPPTSIDRRAVVGIMAGSRTLLVESADFVSAYHSLHQKVVG